MMDPNRDLIFEPNQLPQGISEKTRSLEYFRIAGTSTQNGSLQHHPFCLAMQPKFGPNKIPLTKLTVHLLVRSSRQNVPAERRLLMPLQWTFSPVAGSMGQPMFIHFPYSESSFCHVTIPTRLPIAYVNMCPMFPQVLLKNNRHYYVQ